jgi:hypothetical protein
VGIHDGPEKAHAGRPGVARQPRWQGRRTSGLARDSEGDLTPAFVVREGAYVSARWPADAHLFARTFAEVLEGATRRDDTRVSETNFL